MTNEDTKAHIDMLIAHKDKALKTHPYFNGTTNGDVIKAVFPNIKCWVLTDHKEIIALNYKEVVDWWNAPYREGGYK